MLLVSLITQFSIFLSLFRISIFGFRNCFASSRVTIHWSPITNHHFYGRGVGVGDTDGLAVGVGVGVESARTGAWIRTGNGEPGLKKPTVAVVVCGAWSESNLKLYNVPKRIAFAF